MKTRSVGFSAAFANSRHVMLQIRTLIAGGGTFLSYYEPDDALAVQIANAWPHAKRTSSFEEILADSHVDMVTTSAIPNKRADIAVRAMRSGKDVLIDKAPCLTLNELEMLMEMQAQTKRIYAVFFSEHYANPATVEALRMVRSGSIGKLVHFSASAPHRLDAGIRQPWFFDEAQNGGILADIGSHQFEQFLSATGSNSAVIDWSRVSNLTHPELQGFSTMGEVCMHAGDVHGYFRVDWLSPEGLPSRNDDGFVWGDGRLVLTGTSGTIEVRKNIDVAGRPDGNHLILVTGSDIQYIDCKQAITSFGGDLISDVIERPDRAVIQSRCFASIRLSLEAQAKATRIGFLNH